MMTKISYAMSHSITDFHPDTISPDDADGADDPGVTGGAGPAEEDMPRVRPLRRRSREKP
jgi:hypothetical protein